MERIAPINEAEAAEAVRGAAEKGVSFEIVSGRTKRGLGRAAESDALLDMIALTGILNYEPDELILTARAATPVAEITAALAGRKQILAFEPADWGPLYRARAGGATLAGVAAANASGARRVKAGAVRDHLIGCRFVNGLGETIRCGGRVVKNVSGFDISKLMCGAFGTLGVITEMTLRVVPAPPRAPALAFTDCPPEIGLSLLRQAARLPLEPTGLAYLSAAACTASRTASAANLSRSNGVALIRVEGAGDPVIDKIARLRAAFAELDATLLEDEAAAALFREIGDGTPFLAQDSDIWRLFVPPSDAYAAATESEAQFWYADWGGGALWLALPASRAVSERLAKITAKTRGHAVLMRAGAEARALLPVFQPEPPARAALSRAVKAAFDPHRLFNPFRMFEEW